MARFGEFLSQLTLPTLIPAATTAWVGNLSGPQVSGVRWVVQSYQVTGSSPAASEALIGTVDIFIGPASQEGSISGLYWVDGTFGCNLPLVADFVDYQRVVPPEHSIWAAVTGPQGGETYIFKGSFVEEEDDEP